MQRPFAWGLQVRACMSRTHASVIPKQGSLAWMDTKACKSTLAWGHLQGSTCVIPHPCKARLHGWTRRHASPRLHGVNHASPESQLAWGQVITCMAHASPESQLAWGQVITGAHASAACMGCMDTCMGRSATPYLYPIQSHLMLFVRTIDSIKEPMQAPCMPCKRSLAWVPGGSRL